MNLTKHLEFITLLYDNNNTDNNISWRLIVAWYITYILFCYIIFIHYIYINPLSDFNVYFILLFMIMTIYIFYILIDYILIMQIPYFRRPGLQEILQLYIPTEVCLRFTFIGHHFRCNIYIKGLFGSRTYLQTWIGMHN